MGDHGLRAERHAEPSLDGGLCCNAARSGGRPRRVRAASAVGIGYRPRLKIEHFHHRMRNRKIMRNHGRAHAAQLLTRLTWRCSVLAVGSRARTEFPLCNSATSCKCRAVCSQSLRSQCVRAATLLAATLLAVCRCSQPTANRDCEQRAATASSSSSSEQRAASNEQRAARV